MKVRLEDYTSAYREVYDTKLPASAVMRRIRATLREAEERSLWQRTRKWMLGAGCTVVVGAAAAWASPLGESVVRGFQNTTNGGSSDSVPASTGAVAPTDGVSSSTASAPFSESPAIRSASVADRLSVSPSITLETQTDVRTVKDLERSVSARSRHAKTVPRGGERAEAPEGAGARGFDVSSLYRDAQRLQFVEHNYAAALRTWERYLASGGEAALRADAAYNHAVCLVQLGRYEQARQELQKLTAPAAPAAYRSRAATVLQALASARK